MEFWAVGFGIFLATVIVIELLVFGVRNMRSTQRSKIRKRLRKYTYVEGGGADGADILKKKVYSEIPILNALLGGVPFLARFENLLVQANAKYPAGFYLLLVLFLALVGFLVGRNVNHNTIVSVLMALALGSLPYFYLVRQGHARTEKFKKQMPDGLDLVARALKAGHAFSGGISMAADEFEDPLGPEFAEMLDEINFGVSVPEALKNLTTRIQCEELKYFVMGVILQRETGGNLAELIQTLSNLIREKFKFQGKVRTLTAEGKLSAIVLSALPFLVAGFIWLNNPAYLEPLVNEPFGQVLLLIAVIMMIFGMIFLRRMVSIQV
jgi:tight adherence protein B